MTYDPRLWLSISQLKSVARCGRAFQLERIEKKPSRPACWTVRGTASHDSIETWEKSGRSIDAVEYLREEAWPKALEETIAKYPDTSQWILTPRVKSFENDLKLRLNDAVEQVTRYVSRALDEADLWQVEASEIEFKLEPEGEDFIVRGYIDQLIRWSDGDLTIRDLKTGGDSGEANMQLGMYKLGLKQAMGIDVTWADFWYLKLDRGSQPVDLRPYTQEYMVQEFRKLVAIKKQGLYIANPSKDTCKFCGVAEFCLESKQ